MAKKPSQDAKKITFQVSTTQRPDFKGRLAAYVFDAYGELAERVEVRDGKVELTLPGGDLGRTRVFVAPADEKLVSRKLTPAVLERLSAYEPVLQPGGALVNSIEIPGSIIDCWPICFCWVPGRVLRQSDNRAVCNARVHICEVDRVPWLISRLSDIDVLRLRDDLLSVLSNPPIPRPRPVPGPEPGPYFPAARWRQTGSELSVFRFSSESVTPTKADLQGARGSRVSLNPQPLPPGEAVALNPQPLPPRSDIQLPAELQTRFRSTATLVVRNALIENWKLLIPWLCYWLHWRAHFRCDEVAVVTTDGQGRFEALVIYPCAGDHPDLYFWVEYDLGSGFETVYRPWIACNTYWNYACGSEVTIRVSDPRVPGCGDEPDLPACQVVVLSLGVNVAVRQVQTASGEEGLTNNGDPFGSTLEPRVDFSRTELIVNKNIPYYRWSYRRLSGPDGTSVVVEPGSVPLNSWAVMARDVYRHYKVGTSFPSDLMGPMPTGPGAAPMPNLFRIRPPQPPSGNEWVVLNEHVDLATAYFDSSSLAGAPGSGPSGTDDLAAGRYELKLELFDAGGALVNWTAKGIDLRITDQDAPFGTGTVTTSPAPDYNRVLVGGDTFGFRMVVRIDNSRCSAEILPVGGTVTPDPVCGFHNYSTPLDIAGLSFVARHPNNFADYSFVTTRGPAPEIPDASTSGKVGGPGSNGFSLTGSFNYSKGVVVANLLGPCSNAAYSERLDVTAKATDGYGRLSGYDAWDNAAFALAIPCPDCEAENRNKDAENRGRADGIHR